MPWVAVIVGALLCIVALKPGNDMYDLARTVEGDFSGEHGFLKWIVAIVIIGAVGYLPDMGEASTLFLVLCLIAFVLSNTGVFAKAQKALS